MGIVTDVLAEVTGLCETCLTLAPASIIRDASGVYLQKRCDEHGEHSTLIASDPVYYQRALRTAAALVPPTSFQKDHARGCPYDCGLCSEHEQRTCAAIIEVTDDCNMRCPTCIASSYPGAGKQKSLELVQSMIAIASAASPDIVMLSGGEPTIHSQIESILQSAVASPIRHVMLITNGVRIATDRRFAEFLALFRDRLEIYLQFDALTAEALIDIRGADLRSTRDRALNELERLDISTTLVCVAKKGVNDDQFAAIVEHGLRYKCVRGVTFQPIKDVGRNEAFEKDQNYITLTEVRRTLIQGGRFGENDLIPHPCCPQQICIGYLRREGPHTTPVTERLFTKDHADRRSGSFARAGELATMLYFTPDMSDADFQYARLFRVAIVSFLDRFTFTVEAARQSCVHFVTPEGLLIPLDTYYWMSKPA